MLCLWDTVGIRNRAGLVGGRGEMVGLSVFQREERSGGLIGCEKVGGDVNAVEMSYSRLCGGEWRQWLSGKSFVIRTSTDCWVPRCQHTMEWSSSSEDMVPRAMYALRHADI
jgi:hypothetical protein